MSKSIAVNYQHLVVKLLKVEVKGTGEFQVPEEPTDFRAGLVVYGNDKGKNVIFDFGYARLLGLGYGDNMYVVAYKGVVGIIGE